MAKCPADAYVMALLCTAGQRPAAHQKKLYLLEKPNSKNWTLKVVRQH